MNEAEEGNDISACDEIELNNYSSTPGIPVILDNEEQSPNINFPIEVKEDGIDICFN